MCYWASDWSTVCDEINVRSRSTTSGGRRDAGPKTSGGSDSFLESTYTGSECFESRRRVHVPSSEGAPHEVQYGIAVSTYVVGGAQSNPIVDHSVFEGCIYEFDDWSVRTSRAHRLKPGVVCL